jgi:SAM-dependent methyltransferase
MLEINHHWDKVLTIQTDVSLPLELSSYYLSNAWHRAHKVLDVGCGNGYYLSRVATEFPHKSYSGLDHDPELLQLARHRYPGVHWILRDALEHTGEFDFLIARAILQHIHNHRQLALSLRSLLSANGSLLIVQGLPSGTFAWPPAPRTVQEIFDLHRIREINFFRGRSPMDHFLDFALDLGFEQLSRRTLLVPSTFNNGRDIMTRQLADTLGLLHALRPNDETLRAIQEWDEWSSAIGAYVQLELDVVELRTDKLT